MTNLKNLFKSVFILTVVFFLASCGKDDEPVITLPTANFDFTVAADNSGMVTFTNTSLEGTSYSWDFGDGVGTSTEASPTYTYAETGNYTVSLTAINADGQNALNKDVSVTISALDLITAGDMSDESAWTFRQVWGDPDNAVDHAFDAETFKWDNADGTSYSQSYFWQEVTAEAGKTYKFSADITAPAGTKDIWFELYFGNEDPATADDYGSNGLRLYVSSFDDPASGCANDAFDGDFVSVAQGCTPAADQLKILPADGTFTLTADELTSNGTIYVVFKSGSWDSADNYKDGITLDNVSIAEL